MRVALGLRDFSCSVREKAMGKGGGPDDVFLVEFRSGVLLGILRTKTVLPVREFSDLSLTLPEIYFLVPAATACSEHCCSVRIFHFSFYFADY